MSKYFFSGVVDYCKSMPEEIVNSKSLISFKIKLDKYRNEDEHRVSGRSGKCT